MAYPAITLIQRAKAGATLVAQRPDVGAADSLARLAQLAVVLRAGQPSPAHGVSLVECVGTGSQPWVLGSSSQRALLRRLEAQFPALEDAGCASPCGW